MDLLGPVVGNLKDILSLSSRHIISTTLFLSISCLLLLHLPKHIIDIFYLDNFRTNNQELLGQVAFASLC
jgi:hypothetical protein